MLAIGGLALFYSSSLRPTRNIVLRFEFFTKCRTMICKKDSVAFSAVDLVFGWTDGLMAKD